MRTSSLRHPVAVLRKICEISPSELAHLVKFSLSTIQSVEMGRIPISEELAQEIGAVTGVDAVWLLRGDPTVKPTTPEGHGYTLPHYRDARAYKKIARDPMMKITGKVEGKETVEKITPRLRAIFSAASTMNRLNLAKWKMEKFMEKMEETFECGKN